MKVGKSLLFGFVVNIGTILYLLYNYYSVESSGKYLEATLLVVLSNMTLVRFYDAFVKDRLTLKHWFFLGTYIVLITSALRIFPDILRGDMVSVTSYMDVDVIHASTALILIFICVLSTEIGYSIGRLNKIRVNDKTDYTLHISNQNLLNIISIIIVSIQIYLVYTGRVGYESVERDNSLQFAFLYHSVNILSPFVLVLYSILLFNGGAKSLVVKIVFAISFAASMSYAVLSGFKEEVISTFIYVALPFYVIKKYIPWRYVLVAAFIFLIIYPINNNYRDVLSKTSLDKVSAFGISLAMTLDGNILQTLSDGTDNYSDRMSLFPMAMYGIHISEDWIYYQNLNRYIYLPVSWIMPRFVIPDKPKSDIGTNLYEMITGHRSSSVTPSTYVWAYLEGGIIQAFLVFLLFGYILFVVDRVIGINTSLGLIIYSITFSTVFKAESDVYFIVSSLLQTILVSYIFHRLWIKK
jgi:hypothetical protein